MNDPAICATPSVPRADDAPCTPTYTVGELFPMTMTVHRQNRYVESDVEISRAGIRGHAIAAEDALHDLGAISIINSDSMGMGRMAETVRRTWQLAHVQALAHGGGESNSPPVMGCCATSPRSP
ncbi:hypothetical protein ACFVW1_14645 [Streptomyces olivochromogenes]|uniref:hypothetical protein n=1 Tax=Streptomyces olivochromogenes TaxID=1963 RepID=UPI0036DA3693